MRLALIVLCAAGLIFTTACGDETGGNGSTDRGEPPRDAGTSDARPTDAEGSDDASGPADAEPTDGDMGGAPDGGDAGPGTSAPKVILMIGDGMGRGHLEASSLYATGRPKALFMHSLPAQGEIITASLSGLTDSAAAATAMATGIKTFNGHVGVDGETRPLVSITEVAKRRGMSTGIVTTASLPHATPAGFSAHYGGRYDYVEIAKDQAMNVRPAVMLGGGLRFYLPAGAGSDRHDEGLIVPLKEAGYEVATDRAALLAARDKSKKGLLGLFASNDMPYVYDMEKGLDPARPQDVPSLEEMSMEAIRFLEQNDKGFFLMIEGAKIDMASHLNGTPEANASDPPRWLDRVVEETLAFDRAVAAVSAWAKGQTNVTILVTADHECGGLEVVRPAPAGQMPEVSWLWGSHTNARVDLFGSGPGTEVFEDRVRDNTWIHSVLESQVTGEPLKEPRPGLVVDGHLEDLRHPGIMQTVESGFGPGKNRLDRLWLDADAHGLAIGVEGLFEWGANTLIVLLDIDFGNATGPAELRGVLGDRSKDDIDRILSELTLLAPRIPGFGVDFAIADWGGTTVQHQTLDKGGLRGLRAPFGSKENLGWYPMTTNYGEGVLVKESGLPRAGEGWEGYVPWSTLYPDANGGVAPGATIGIAAVLVNNDGGYTSNQALPPFPAGTSNPGRTGVELPGIVTFKVDADGDGRADGNGLPERRP